MNDLTKAQKRTLDSLEAIGWELLVPGENQRCQLWYDTKAVGNFVQYRTFKALLDKGYICFNRAFRGHGSCYVAKQYHY